jgi:predicted regulator of Ras-like GTPase activity (Roadblock/LC7/MglB family)
MDDQLLALLDYQGVLGAVGATRDGLVIGAAGLSGDDAEVVGAAGSTLWSSIEEAGEESGMMEVDGAAIHLVPGSDIAVVVLAESEVPHDALVPIMKEALEALTGVFS